MTNTISVPRELLEHIAGSLDKIALQSAFSVSDEIRALLAAAPKAEPQLVSDEVPCSTHPDAPHGFNRNGSHSLDRYVCDCEGWVPLPAPPEVKP